MEWDADAEFRASYIFQLAEVDPADAPGPMRLAEIILGVDGVRSVPGMDLPGDGALCRRTFGVTPFTPEPKIRDVEIQYRRSLRKSPKRLVRTISHELGELSAREIPYTGQDIEGFCDRVGIRVTIPAVALRADLRHPAVQAVHARGLAPLVRWISETYVVSEVDAAIRYAQVFELAAAVKPRGRDLSYVGCSPDAFGGDSCVFELAKAPAEEVKRNGLIRIEMDDEAGAFVLVMMQ